MKDPHIVSAPLNLSGAFWTPPWTATQMSGSELKVMRKLFVRKQAKIKNMFLISTSVSSNTRPEDHMPLKATPIQMRLRCWVNVLHIVYVVEKNMVLPSKCRSLIKQSDWFRGFCIRTLHMRLDTCHALSSYDWMPKQTCLYDVLSV